MSAHKLENYVSEQVHWALFGNHLSHKKSKLIENWAEFVLWSCVEHSYKEAYRGEKNYKIQGHNI